MGFEKVTNPTPELETTVSMIVLSLDQGREDLAIASYGVLNRGPRNYVQERLDALGYWGRLDAAIENILWG